MKPDNPELIANLRILNDNIKTLAELQAMPQCDMVMHRTILAMQEAAKALANVQAWRDAALACAQLETVH